MSGQESPRVLSALEYKAGELRSLIAKLQADLAALERTLEIVDRMPDCDYEPPLCEESKTWARPNVQ